MGVKRYKNAIARFLSGESGEIFFNVAYSIGAAIVILGALFKILHLTGGDVLLSVGMGTEVVMFILTAFDRPRHHDPQPQYAPAPAQIVGTGVGPSDSEAGSNGAAIAAASATVQGAAAPGATVIVGGQTAGGTPAGAAMPAGGTIIVGATGVPATGGIPAVTAPAVTAAMSSIDEIEAAIAGYKEQMEALSRNIAGLNTLYEVQLRGVSSQIDSLDGVNRGMRTIRSMYDDTAARAEEYSREARRLTDNMQRLNDLYENMLAAMTRPAATTSN